MIERGMLLADRYRIDHRLGAGGMAEVWQAVDTRLERDVAVKILRERDEALATRLRRESRVLAGLAHPAVVAVFDAGEVDGRPFLVLELVRGETLAALLQREGTLAPERVASLGAALADGLAHAHALGVVHRDVKPSNILVDEDGRARLVDFGIARSDDGTRLTGTGLSIGTAAYLSPEQLEAPDQVGPAADVYSLGLVLAEALTGRRVFPGPAPAAALARLRIDPPLADVPTAWAPLLQSMTRRDPATRPQAAAVVTAVPGAGAEDLATAGAGAAGALTEPIALTATMPVAAAAPAAVPLDPAAADVGADPGRRRLWLVTAAVVLLLGIGLAVALAGRGDPDGGTAVDTTEAPATPGASTVTPVTAPPTTVAPTTTLPPTTETTADERGGRDKPPKPDRGNGQGRDGDDEDDGDD